MKHGIQTKVTRFASLGLLLLGAATAPLGAGEYYDLGQPVVGAWQRFAWLVFEPQINAD